MEAWAFAVMTDEDMEDKKQPETHPSPTSSVINKKLTVKLEQMRGNFAILNLHTSVEDSLQNLQLPLWCENPNR